MSGLRLRYEVDAQALVARNLGCDEERSVRAYLDALAEALHAEFAGLSPAIRVCAGPREAVTLEGVSADMVASLQLRARAVADAVKRAAPWPVYD